jgi:Glycosyl hydrolase family 26/Fibronectin type III domain
VGTRKPWLATAGVLAVLLSIFATGGSAARKQQASAPVNTSTPTISGTPVVGGTLTGSVGTWTGSGMRFTDQWLLCDNTGGQCAPINGATGTSLTLTASQLGSTLRFSVVASSRRGSTSATSAATSAVTQAPSSPPPVPGAPSNLVASNPTANSVNLSWNASTGTDPAVGYDVYVNQTRVATPSGTSAAVGSLSCGTTYTFAVDAYDAAGTKSAQASTTASTSACSSSSSSKIYWGAWVEGQQTYSYLYGGTWGNVPWSSQTWTKYEQNVGKNPSIIHFGVGTPWDHSFSYWNGPVSQVQNAGALSLIDMSTGSVALRNVASGAYDSSITTWAKQAAAWGHPFFLRFDWEMNGSWFPWGTTSSNQNTPTDYVAAWRHVHNLFTAAGASNVTWVWCPNTEWSSSVPYSQLYPGDAYVDWTCLDGYNKNSSSQSFSSLYTQSYNDLLKIAPTKPIMIGEIGSIEYGAGVKANWITNMLDVLPTSFPKIKALVWFNWRISDSGTWHGFEVESSASSQSAFAGGIASPYYSAASSFTMPTQLKPIPPPS